jgi:hypothetical protein
MIIVTEAWNIFLKVETKFLKFTFRYLEDGDSVSPKLWYLPTSRRPLRSSNYGVCHWTKGSRVQTRPRTMNLWAINICSSTTSFGGEVKLLAPCRKVIWHVKDPCGVWKRYFIGKVHGHFSPSFPYFATRCMLVTAKELWWMNWEWLELSGERTIYQKMVAVLWTPCAIPPRNS